MMRHGRSAAAMSTVAVLALGLAGCAAQPPARSAAARPQPQAKIPVQNFAPNMVAETPPSPEEEAKLTNDPSAPMATPLCGSALREEASAGAAVYSEGLASGSMCPRNACFEPATGTYIAATGARSVCR